MANKNKKIVNNTETNDNISINNELSVEQPTIEITENNEEKNDTVETVEIESDIIEEPEKIEEKIEIVSEPKKKSINQLSREELRNYQRTGILPNL